LKGIFMFNPSSSSLSAADSASLAPQDSYALSLKSASTYSASFHLDGSSYEVARHQGRTTLQGRTESGAAFELHTSGGMQGRLNYRSADGMPQQQSFDFQNDALLHLPNGDVLALHTSDQNMALALLNRAGTSALVLNHLGADGSNLHMSQHSLGAGEALSFLNQKFGRPGHPFIAQQYRREHLHAHHREHDMPYARWMDGPCGRGICSTHPRGASSRSPVWESLFYACPEAYGMDDSGGADGTVIGSGYVAY
jgi:hypothetical protein